MEYKSHYGVSNSFQRNDVKLKIKQTNLEKYGVDNPSKSKTVWKKIRKTWKKNYGTSHPLQNEDIKNKARETRNIRYPDRIGYCNRKPTELTNLEKYGHSMFFVSDVGRMTKSNFILRYGEDGEKRWNTYVELKKQTLNNFIDRYGVEEGNIRFNNWKSRCKQTVDNFIIRYGEELGTIKYNSYLETKLSRLVTGSISNLQRNIAEDLRSMGYTIKENVILTDGKKKYFYDIVFEDKIIEVHGDFWHGNPTYYKSTDVLKHPGGPVLAETLWQKDRNKAKIANDNGYTVLVVWESEYKTNKTETLERIRIFCEEHK